MYLCITNVYVIEYRLCNYDATYELLIPVDENVFLAGERHSETQL